MEKTSIQIVWYKRDLRIADHGPLQKAAESGLPVLPLYIVEPMMVNAPTFDPAHWTFIRQCLIELRDNLSMLGQPLVVRMGDAVDVLSQLANEVTIEQIWAHEETTDLRSFMRDDAVREWARAQAIQLDELPKNGIVRGLSLDRRDAWKSIREDRMHKPPWQKPEAIMPVQEISPGHIPDSDEIGLLRNQRELQPAGEKEAHKMLQGFLLWRGSNFIKDEMSPLKTPASSSRISPHLAYGTLSMRTAVQEVRKQLINFKHMPVHEKKQRGKNWVGSLRLFEKRLLQRDETMQQTEWNPSLEIANEMREFDALRPYGNEGWPMALLDAWQQGQTGYPLIDASMRFLAHGGWLSNRMRGMVVSFAAHDLWLDWRGFAPHLAQSFLDFEPALHYVQLQQLSGTTIKRGIRWFDPLEEGKRHDSQGEFIRRWCPELAGVPRLYIHQPEKMTADEQNKYGCILGRDYPLPVVDHTEALAKAKAEIGAIRSPKAKAFDSGLGLPSGETSDV